MTAQTHNFEADTGKILNIVINSLYSDPDIFLRELLSNASDAHPQAEVFRTDRAKYLELWRERNLCKCR